MVLLDWEKAFDKVEHEALFEAMKRMNIDDKLVRLTKQLYKNPQFYVEMEGKCSEWKTQTTGIRQGCTLSPYLFLILMTAIFHDVHDDDELNKLLEKDKVIGAIFHEILYADDTIIYSRSHKTLSKLLAKIQTEGERYGLKLNEEKCEAININTEGTVLFKNGTKVKKKTRKQNI